MTSFLTFSVYALRLSNDLPTQSSFVPLISWYFIFSIILTLCSIAWFYLHNNFLGKGKMPSFIETFSRFLKNFFTCSFACIKLPPEVNKVKPAFENNAENLVSDLENDKPREFLENRNVNINGNQNGHIKITSKTIFQDVIFVIVVPNAKAIWLLKRRN